MVRSKTKEFPAKIVKFPQPFPTISKIPNFLLENSQSGFYCIFINKYIFTWPPELKNFENFEKNESFPLKIDFNLTSYST